MTDKIVVFDIWGDYAHFKKIYTTSSPLSYSFPPRTALSGLIGAILGIEKNDCFSYFTKDKANIACRIISPVKKVRVGLNLIDTKKSMHIIQNRTQIKFEFIKDPKYRIYFRHSSISLYEKFKELVKSHQSVFTPCLGLSQLICNFTYIGEFDASAKSDDELVPIDSVVPNRYLKKPPNFEKGKEYFSENLPLEMGESREVIDYGEILFERRGKTIQAVVTSFWEVGNGERILFL
jgi:CRISPR-associated protein Cas5h